MKADKESRVRYELEDLGGTTKLTVTHDQFENETPSFVGTSPPNFFSLAERADCATFMHARFYPP